MKTILKNGKIVRLKECKDCNKRLNDCVKIDIPDNPLLYVLLGIGVILLLKD
jgi:hypothetical protein